MDSELFLKVSQREERTNRIEAFLVFPVAALYFSVVSWGVRADELVADAKISGSLFKKGLVSTWRYYGVCGIGGI